MLPKMTGGPKIIGIAGASGSGKSYVADRLTEKIDKTCLCLSIDNFYRDQSHLSPKEKFTKNYDLPSAIDWATLLTAINALKRGNSADVPVYDFTRHRRQSDYLRCDPTAIVLIEGLWVFHFPEIRELFARTLYVDCPRSVRLDRRIMRDASKRGRSRQSICDQFEKQVIPAEEIWVLPQKDVADVVIKSPVSEVMLSQIVKNIEPLPH